MSKVFSLAGLRLGWIAAQKDIIDECCKHRDYTTISCGMLDDIIASHALKNYNKILERNLSLVKKNASILENWVENEPFINYIKPKAGSTAFLKYDLPVPSEKLCIDLLNNYGTFLVPGKCFDMEGWLRIGYACDTQVLKKGLSNLSEYINKIKKTA
jgi:aspartate/methionine/tyrosine aminotransferase